jgi:uncharacterized OsmC-like protein
MADDTHRSVELVRTAAGRFRATNTRGVSIDIGGDGDFSPVELLLAAIGGCSGMDVDIFTTRRAEPTMFEMTVAGEKVRDEGGNHMTDLVVTYRVRFPDGAEGDAARTILPDAIQRSHDRLCTVSRTVELPTPVAIRSE